MREREERSSGDTKEERRRAELEGRDRGQTLKQMERPRGETKGRDRRRDGAKIQKRETEDEKYKGERELKRTIVEIHRGEI